MRRAVSTPARKGLAVAAFALAVALPILRQAGGAVPVWRTVYAEDGVIYLADARTRPILSTLVRPYNGYLQLTDRLLALPTRWLPLDTMAWYFVLVGCIVNALLALFVYRASRQFIRCESTRLVIAGLAVIAPLLATELTANIADLVFLLPFACFWALVTDGEDRLGVATRVGIVALTALSTPLAALYLPLAIARAIARRRGATLVARALVAGVAAQALIIVTTADHGARSGGSLGELGILYPARVVVSYLVGERYASTVWIRGGALAVLAAGVLVALLLVVLARRQPAQAPIASAWWAVGYSVVIFGASVAARGTSALHLSDGLWNGNGPRYAATPLLLLASAIGILVDRHELTVRGRPHVARQLFAAHAAVVVAVCFWLPTDRNDGPAWNDALGTARRACDDGRASVEIPVTPAPDFTITLPCDRLDP